MKKQMRTAQNLPANIEDDLDILQGWARKLYPRFKSQVMDIDDIFQILCETYEEGKKSYTKKERIIPIRPFVFNYIDFILRRTYRGQFKFEHRDVIVSDIVIDPKLSVTDDDIIKSQKNQKNPFLFENDFDLNNALEKYTYDERIVIYYKFFLGQPLREVRSYLPPGKKWSYMKLRKFHKRLKNDPDLILLKEESK